MNKIYVVDTETTGFAHHPERGHPEVIELCVIDVSGDLKEFRLLGNIPVEQRVPSVIKSVNETAYVERFNPSMEISTGAFKVHGIAKRDLIGCKPSTEAVLPEDTKYILGHFVEYDHKCLGWPKVSMICTKKLAALVDKAGMEIIPSKSLIPLIRQFYPDHAESLVEKSHSAKQDCINTILLFAKLLSYFPGLETWDDLYEFQKMKV